jgi:hypothetical protein
MTDKDGFGFPTLLVSKTTAPGIYEVVVEAPDLQLVGSATYTVSLTPKVNTAFNVAAIELIMGLDGTDVEGNPVSDTGSLGGNYVRGELTGNQFQASGYTTVNGIPGQGTYVITLSDDLGRVISGSFSFNGNEGQTLSYNFFDVPRDRDAEATLSKEKGLACTIFVVQGSAVTDHISSFSISDPTSPTSWTRYWADESCDLVVVLAAATESQLTDLLGN